MIVLIAIMLVFVNLIGYMLVLLAPKDNLLKIPESWPYVSILIAVRNEESRIDELLASLQDLDYPEDKIEILVGDDHSQDNTWQKLQTHSFDRVRTIQAQAKHTGKARMLHELARLARGEFILMIDADIRPPKVWVKALVMNMQSYDFGVAMTSVKGTNLLCRLQSVDWLSHQSLIGWFTRYFEPMTAWGNNMIVRKNTFDSVDGYEDILDSIVEDVALLKKVTKIGRVKVITHADGCVETIGERSLQDVIAQRLRWIRGFDLMPVYVKQMALIKYLFLPSVIFLSVSDSPFWMFFILLKALMIFLLIRPYTVSKKRSDIKWWDYICFEGYEFIVYYLSFVRSIFKKTIIWKGRSYD